MVEWGLVTVLCFPCVDVHVSPLGAIVLNTVCVHTIKLRFLLPLSSLLLFFYWQSGTDAAYVYHHILCFSSFDIPSRMYRPIPAVNTLYIFMFWEVLSNVCVNRETRLVQETLLSTDSTFMSFPAFMWFDCFPLAAKVWGLYVSHCKFYTFFTVLILMGVEVHCSISECTLQMVHCDGFYCKQLLALKWFQKMFTVGGHEGKNDLIVSNLKSTLQKWLCFGNSFKWSLAWIQLSNLESVDGES